jgi:hypothetical protein
VIDEGRYSEHVGVFSGAVEEYGGRKLTNCKADGGP